MREILVEMAHSDLERMGFGGFDRIAASQDDPAKIHLLTASGGDDALLLETNEPVDEAAIEALDHLTDAELVSERPGTYEYLLKMAAQPFDARLIGVDGTMFFKEEIVLDEDGLEFTLVTDNETLGSIRERSEEKWNSTTFDCTIQRVTEYSGLRTGADRLTDRQREVVLAAYANGYYEIPRESSSEELAEELDLEKSTFLEHLRRAERNLVARLAEREGETRQDDDGQLKREV